MRTMARKPKRKPKPANPWPARLSKLRTSLGLTQAQAAARVRISQSQWSAFEAGNRTPTRPIAYLIDLLERGELE